MPSVRATSSDFEREVALISGKLSVALALALALASSGCALAERGDEGVFERGAGGGGRDAWVDCAGCDSSVLALALAALRMSRDVVLTLTAATRGSAL
eukprot:1577987-Pleurochrysis_carterae.AAC.3